MTRQKAVVDLERSAQAVRRLGAALPVGSTARDETHADSDLDVFVDYDADARFSLIELVAIKDVLEAATSVRVDITTRDSLHPQLKDEIERSAVKIF